MPYEFTVERVEYETGPHPETVLHGRVKAGAIDGPEWVSVPTHGGVSFVAWTSGMQVHGPLEERLTPDLECSVSLALQNHPPKHDVVVPCVALGIGITTPAGLEHTLVEPIARQWFDRFWAALGRLVRR